MISHLYSHEFIFDSTVNCEKKEGSYCAYTDVLWFTLGLKEIHPRTSNPYSVSTRWMPMVDKPILTCPAKEAVFKFTICMPSRFVNFQANVGYNWYLNPHSTGWFCQEWMTHHLKMATNCSLVKKKKTDEIVSGKESVLNKDSKNVFASSELVQNCRFTSLCLEM